MKVLRAQTAGFCMGVGLALQTLDKALARKADAVHDEPAHRLFTYGPIIHNPQVLEVYAQLGVIVTESLADIHPGDEVVIRAHGIPRQEEDLLRTRGAVIRDATCPKVKQAQLAIAKATEQGQTLLLFGEAEHPEVRGLVSYAGGMVHIFESLEALAALPLAAGQGWVLAAQTTQDQAEFARIGEYLHGLLGELPVLRTICQATGKRQDEVLTLAATVDGLVVVGGKTSGNTRRLAALARERGVETWHIETPDELPLDALRGKACLGLTAGASTPREIIDKTQAVLERI